MKKILFVGLLILLVTSLVSYFAYQQVFAPLSDSDEIILVPREASFEDLKDSLFVHGLLKNDAVFDMFCEKKRYSKIHPGRYFVPSVTDLNSLVNISIF